MERTTKSLKDIPRYGWLIAIGLFVMDTASYYFGTLFSRLLGTISWQIAPKIPVIDDNIPFIAILVIPYLLSYAFWVVGAAFVSLTDKKNYTDFIVSMCLAYTIGFLFFALMPTYIDRLAEGALSRAEGPGLLPFLLRMTYNSDGGRYGFNLFPSFHCMISVFCYLGIRKRTEVSKGIRIYTLVSTIVICLSTVCIKQHYILDVFGGIGLAIACFAAVKKFNLSAKILKTKP